MNRYCVIGINHKFAPLEIRERVAYPDRRIPAALRSMREAAQCEEAVILSTCNRVELYAFTSDPAPQERLLKLMADDHGLQSEFLARYVYFHRGRNAVEHLLRVAGGLDSLVLGETQIVNQVKKSYLLAQSENATGKALNSLFHRAFNVAKRLHSETGISTGQLSTSSVAVTFARRVFENLSDKTALLVGVGEVGELTLNYLKDSGIGRTIVCSRTLDRAREVATRYGGDAVPLELIEDYLPRADIVISQTASERPIFSREMFKQALKKRGWRSIFVLDLAVPRDVAPDVDELPDVYLYNVDDLEQVVAEHALTRSHEIKRCTEIITQEVDGFLAGFQSFSAAPIIKALSERAHAIREAEVNRLLAHFVDLPPDQKAEIAMFAEQLVNKLLHPQISAIKAQSRREDAADSLRVLARALGVDDIPAAPKPEAQPQPENQS
ncbi:MAG: glutamyl-tRNA reductase [Planctomycetaceae bacterium]|nr:glutamyl-tRNA reductase [Planctomycetota bacterium]NUO15637.1 glutamyl-tRNA reductase [Planctomycetaceae bacterium]GIK52306.1 MAG: glutamyl-tRNA reductase [Planctomycetota bacterium]